MKQLPIRKDGWIYKIAYGCRRSKPKQSTICGIFWAFTTSLFLIYPLAFLTYTILLAVCFVVGLLFAKRPAIFEEDSDFPFVSYHHWPQWQGENVRPIILIFIYALGHGLYWSLSKLYHQRTEIYALITEFYRLGLLTFILIVLIVNLCWLIRKLRREGVFSLLKAYLQAKKTKLCPLVVFVDQQQ